MGGDDESRVDWSASCSFAIATMEAVLSFLLVTMETSPNASVDESCAMRLKVEMEWLPSDLM